MPASIPSVAITVTGPTVRADAHQCDGIHPRGEDVECSLPVVGLVLDGSSATGRPFCLMHLVEYWRHQDDVHALNHALNDIAAATLHDLSGRGL